MEVLATTRANDSKTGEMLAKVEIIFSCDECKDFEQFCHAHGDDIEEYMVNELSKVLDEGADVIVKTELVELADEFDDDDEESADEEESD